MANFSAAERKVLAVVDAVEAATGAARTYLPAGTVHAGTAARLVEAGVLVETDDLFRRAPEPEAPDAPSGHDVVDGPAASDPPAYDLAAAKAEAEALMAWRKVGKHHGEARPATPNRDAMVAAHAAGASTYAPAKPKPAARPKGQRSQAPAAGRDYSLLGQAPVWFRYKGERFDGYLTGDPAGRVRLSDGTEGALSSVWQQLTGGRAANGHAVWKFGDPGRPVGDVAREATQAATAAHEAA